MDNKVAEVVAAITALGRGHTDRAAEAQIIELLRCVDDDTLDGVVCGLDLNALFGDVDDRIFGPDNFSSLLALLSDTRVAALSVAARARIIDALQRGRTGSRDERAIARLFVATTGADLTELKRLIDVGADHRDLQHLVYGDIDDEEIRAAILAHFARVGGGRGARKVLSDIDDTLYANWKDTRYPNGSVYPGVRQLYRELGGDLVFITARPRDRAGVVERATHALLRGHGIDGATILAGSVAKVLTHEAIAEQKLQNFRELSQLYPEHEFVFIGDSGQGDMAFGRNMRRAEPERVRAVLIHDVVAISLAERALWQRDGVVLFDTYVGAALEAERSGLLDREAVERVARAAEDELDLLALDVALRQTREEELARDIARATRS
jgi:hypothetical protein